VRQQLQKFELKIPDAVPGSETPAVTMPSARAEWPSAAARLFPKLPQLADEPVALPGPNGRPYSLADLHQIGAANNPALRQAISDVAAARGVLKQSVTYPNPTIGYETNPNNNNTGSATLGFFVDQVIKTGGKLTLAGAANEMNLRNAELAVKRARSNLATTIRGDYYTLLVAKETVRVNRALAHFTDEIFRLQADLLGGGFAASHEPAALRSQAFIVRLAHRQAIANYIYAWKQLVADMGLKSLPLSQVEGEVDRLIPYYDYDTVLAHVLRNHTDVLTAVNTLRGTDYSLKLARVTPYPDVEVRGDIWKEHMIQPLQNYFTVVVSIPFPIWDQNKGNILAAAAAKVRAAEGPHAVEVTLTTNLATAYATYMNNLYSMDYYRRNILPDQVRYYRGVFERRRIDPSVAFGDLVQAQQTLTADVTAYLGILGSLWTSVVSVADFLQTDDLFQLSKPMELPRLPDLESLQAWPCPHPNPQLTSAPDEVQAAPAPVPHARATTSPAPSEPLKPGQQIERPNVMAAAGPRSHATDPRKPAADPDEKLPVFDLPWAGWASGKALREHFAKLLGAIESPFAVPTSVAAQPVGPAPGPYEQDVSRRSTAVSLWSSP
jgi:cobalt-zinc-cadmium efflux system outer membrane protein